MVYNTLQYKLNGKRSESFATIDGINYREKINLLSLLNYIIYTLCFVNQHLEIDSNVLWNNLIISNWFSVKYKLYMLFICHII